MATTRTASTHISPADTAPPATVLDELLDSELSYDPIASGGFINHLAMGLIATHRLGATDDELRAWFDRSTASDFLVDRERPVWLDDDVAEIQRLGIDAVVRQRLPDLIDAPLSQFFHAMIRLELAIDAQHPAQVANALRNWAEHGQPLPTAPSGEGGESFAAILSALHRHPDRRPGSMPELRPTADEAWFRATLEHLRADEHLLDDVAASVVALHVAPRNFTSLHLVTGVRAARAVHPFLDADAQHRLALRTAQAVALVATVFLEPEESADRLDDPSPTAPSWQEIGRAAIDTFDPHVTKLVYAARLEETATSDPRYRLVASRQTGLTD